MTNNVLLPLAAASGHWQRGDKALANLRIVFAGLPRIESDINVENVRDAADLLDGGLPPRALMKALGFDTAALDKFNPGQQRVPAGSGLTSGRWANGASAGEPRVTVSSRNSSGATGDQENAWLHSHGSVRIEPIADDGRVKPGGQVIVPRYNPDPLDPAGLNTPLSPAEEQAIADTLNMIGAGRPEDRPTFNPHVYENRPDDITGAQLPIGGSYRTHYVRLPGAVPGIIRIVTEAGGSVYYTRNHYRSFFRVRTP